MTTKTFLTKRAALYKGEVGLFAENEMAEEDIGLFTMNAEIVGELSCPQNIKLQNFLWTMVYKAWQNSDVWIDHHEAMIDLKKRVHFTRMRWDTEKKEMVERVRSMTRINGGTLRALTDRIADVICAEIMPGMQKNDLYREIEEMTGVGPR